MFEDAEKAIEIPKNAEGIKKSIQRQIATGTIATIPTSFDDEDMYQEPIKRVVKPANQLVLTEQEMKEEITR